MSWFWGAGAFDSSAYSHGILHFQLNLNFNAKQKEMVIIIIYLYTLHVAILCGVILRNNIWNILRGRQFKCLFYFTMISEQLKVIVVIIFLKIYFV